MKALLILLALSLCAYAQPTSVGVQGNLTISGAIVPASTTVAGLPAAASVVSHIYIVTDAATAGSCTTGGGTAKSQCRSNGTTWETIGGGVAGPTGATGATGSTGATGATGNQYLCAYANDTAGTGFSNSNTSLIYRACKVFASGVTPVNGDFVSGDWVWWLRFLPAGAWSDSTTYGAGAVVAYKRSTYRSYANGNLNNEPFENSGNWETVAAAGRDGLLRLDDTSSSTTAYTVTLANHRAYDVGGICETAEICVGDVAMIVVNNANTGTTPTVTVNALAAKTIVQFDGTAVLVGQITTSGQQAWYDGTNWRLMTPIGRVVQSFDLATCQDTTPGTGLVLPTANPGVPACFDGSNRDYGVMGFANSGVTTVEGKFTMPANTLRTDASLTFQTALTTGNYVPQLKYACVATSGTTDAAWSTAATATVAANASANFQSYATYASVIPASCAGQTVFWQLYRDAAHASDTAAGTVNGVTADFIHYLVRQ